MEEAEAVRLALDDFSLEGDSYSTRLAQDPTIQTATASAPTSLAPGTIETSSQVRSQPKQHITTQQIKTNENQPHVIRWRSSR